jgi:hypothetical protein
MKLCQGVPAYSSFQGRCFREAEVQHGELLHVIEVEAAHDVLCDRHADEGEKDFSFVQGLAAVGNNIEHQEKGRVCVVNGKDELRLRPSGFSKDVGK